MTGLTTVYYELYIEVRENGFSRITDDKLMELLTNAWNEKGYFEVLAENYELSVNPLRIWFNCYNSLLSKSTEPSYYYNALKFFISLVEYQQS